MTTLMKISIAFKRNLFFFYLFGGYDTLLLYFLDFAIRVLFLIHRGYSNVFVEYGFYFIE